MANESFQPAFDQLLKLIKLKVVDAKSSCGPSVLLVKRVTPLGHTPTETGVSVTHSEMRYFQKEDWSSLAFRLADKIKAEPAYEEFKNSLFSLDEKNHEDEVFRAVIKIIRMLLEGESFDESELLGYLIKSITHKPVPAWVDIDLYGVFVKGSSNVAFNFDGKQFEFHQLSVSDFASETHIHEETRFGMIPPSSVLTIRMNTWRPYEFQIETIKALNILRLFQVCAAKFGRQAWATKCPFSMILGSTLIRETMHVGENTITFTKEMIQKFERFWNFVEPKLPTELGSFEKASTTISIAFERYCDGLMSPYPIERKIAFAIMGLEAIYLGENEVQELMYRLQLRVSKVVSKLKFNTTEVKLHLKEGYKIRNAYIHGGHLSEKEKNKLGAKRINVSRLADELLDFLRISILHLIISRQTKNDFLDLLEESFIDQSANEALETIMKDEYLFLRAMAA